MARSRTFRGAKESLDMAFDPEGDFTLKIKTIDSGNIAGIGWYNSQQYDLTGS